MAGAVARESGLLVEEIGDELLVYDVDRRVAHSLNLVAARVWKVCDGTRDAKGIAAACGLEPDVVVLTLAELARIGLLVGERTKGPVVSRRQVLRRAVLSGAAVGVALPVIRSITAPSPALAASGPLICGSPCSSVDACSKATSGCIHCTSTGSCGASCRSAGQTCGPSTCCSGLLCVHHSLGPSLCQ